ncbi:putative aldehyde dehydrogenase [Xylariales sp. PMI_506]|nr:putative aldehyde dehydrogenase [Xylariales sp. PMI_506]
MGSIQRSTPVDILSNFRNTINGELKSTQETRHGVNPATGTANEPVPVSTSEDVDLAVAAAQDAFKSWGKTPFAERRERMLQFVESIEAHRDGFAKLLTKEQGKPIAFAHMEITSGLNWVKAFCALDLDDEVLRESDEHIILKRYTPIGASVGIVPWNYPLSLTLAKLAPAVLAGNPMIIKPSPFTPYCALKLGELAQQFFPAAVVQVLSGDDNLGPWLTAHPGPEKISFTGSTVTGKKVMEAAAKTMKRVTLELGGNDPAIVCKDVDVEATAQKVAFFSFLNSGQICLAIKRIYVHESIHEQFRDAMVKYVQTLKIGEGHEEGVFMGPIQNATQYERVKGFFADVEWDNLHVAVGGKNDEYNAGFFINPTIIDKPADDSRIVIEEPFGPIVPLLTWSDESDVIMRANSTRMGLGASVWSRDLDQAGRIARQLDAGTVWVNSHFELDPGVPYGGHKESGMGAELGRDGLLAFCNTQVLYLKK